MPGDPNAEARAAHRRATWSSGRVHRDEADDADAEFWQQMTGAERFQAMLELSWEWYGEEASQATGGRREWPHGVRKLR